MEAIREVRRASAAEWDALWSDCASATFFHSRAWAEAWAALGGGVRPDPRWVRFEDGREALLPVCVDDRTTLASPAGCYGGWIARDPLSSAHAQALVSVLLGLQPAIRWRVSPFDPLQHASAPGDAHPDCTHALRLDEDFPHLLRRWRKGHRAAASQAERAGVTVRLAAGDADWRAYFAVYQDTLRRWGDRATSRHPWALFDALSRRDGVQLWLAEREGRLLAGALCLYARTHVAYWHGAAREDAFALRPVHLLIRTALADAQQRGCAWFDFNPSGGHAGVVAFKRNFGAESLPCPVVVRLPARGVVRRVLRRFA
jgi:hypothetical protein